MPSPVLLVMMLPVVQLTVMVKSRPVMSARMTNRVSSSELVNLLGRLEPTVTTTVS